MTDAQAVAMSTSPLVQSVEENGEVRIASTTYSGMDQPLVAGGQNTRWDLDRIDQQSPSTPRLDDQYTACADGTGVRVYVLDTGVLPNHTEFVGRVDSAQGMQDYLVAHNISSILTACWNEADTIRYSPNAGHGTAVASIIGGTQFGVAKNVTLVDGRVADCVFGGTTTARLVGALQWICQVDPNRAGHQSVVNMSLSGQWYGNPNIDSGAMAAAIQTTVDTYNIPVVVAAGNSSAGGDNVFWYSPANAGRAITVGGTNKANDQKWSYSNYGNTTSFYAPAQFIEAASLKVRAVQPLLDRDYYRSELDHCSDELADTCTSGTSFSAPLMTGIVARYLQYHPGMLRDRIVTDLQFYAARSGVTVYESGTGSSLPLLTFQECP
jgi:subtilisin family serine protease